MASDRCLTRNRPHFFHEFIHALTHSGKTHQTFQHFMGSNSFDFSRKIYGNDIETAG